MLSKQGNILNGVVVISNDDVTPYDITTSGDLFYQVSCDYSNENGDGGSNGDGDGQVLVRGGLVVGFVQHCDQLFAHLVAFFIF